MGLYQVLTLDNDINADYTIISTEKTEPGKASYNSIDYLIHLATDNSATVLDGFSR